MRNTFASGTASFAGGVLGEPASVPLIGGVGATRPTNPSKRIPRPESPTHSPLRQPLNESPLERQKDHQDRRDHHHGGGAGQPPVTRKPGRELIVAGRDRQELL